MMHRTGVALVTGASQGIGAAIARRLAADGEFVAINSYPDEDMIAAAKNLATDIQSAGGKATVLPADISDPSSVDTMFTQCEHELGPVRSLVLNAAATGRSTWHEITDDEWDRIADVNLKGLFLCCRRAFTRSDQPENSAIVTVSSVQAKLGAPESLHYATTKAGIIGFTRSLAGALGPRGIRVNCVMPGAIQTEAEIAAFPDQEQVAEIMFASQMLHRRGKPEDIANVVSFLLGDDSSFMTGQTVCVDGGWVLL
ncbi:hypothetical protein BAY59_22785 [Prauserella coralliicola]|nr:hypothetical protein BAY59_22785 [Prauserella coralliicola]